MPITPTNLTKNAISPSATIKGYTRQAVYGIGIYGLATYGVGVPNFQVVTNEAKNTSTFTNLSKN